MKKFLILLFTIIITSSEESFCQTNVSGAILTNSTWSLANDPYIIQSDVYVDTGIVLTIEPGVIVKFDKGKTIIVDGTIRAVGTLASPISFEPDTASAIDFFWAGIYLSDASVPFDFTNLSGSFFQYCNFSYAGIPNLTLDPSGNTAFTVYSEKSLGFDHCTIENSSCGLNGTSGSQVSYNFFRRCTSDGLSGELIRVGQNSAILNNLIYKTTVAVNTGLLSANKNVKVNNNLFIENEFALYNAIDISDSCKFFGNSLIDNTGAYFKVSGGLVYNNTVVRNGINPETFLLGNCSPDFHNNNVLNNESDLQYELEMTASGGLGSTATAENNYWGHTDSAQIAAVIKDASDVVGLCTIDFVPFSLKPDVGAPVLPPVNVTKKDAGNGSVLVKWNSNLETDLEGYKVYYNGYTGYSFTSNSNAGNVDSFLLSSANVSDPIAVSAYDSHVDGVDDQFDGNESWYTLAVPDSSVGIENFSDFSSTVNIFPNPSDGTFQINFEGTKELSILVFEMNGRKVLEQHYRLTDAPMFRIGSPGAYFVRIDSGNASAYQKIIVLP